VKTKRACNRAIQPK